MRVHVPKDPEKRDAILALLEERAYKNHELSNLLRWPQGAVHGVCAKLARDGVLVRLADGAWSYAPVGTPAPPVNRGGRPPTVTGAMVLKVLEAGPLSSGQVADRLEESFSTTQKMLVSLLRAGEVQRFGVGPLTRYALPSYVVPAQPARPVRAPRGALRHPHERPESIVVKAEDEPSWWVGLSREQFAAGIAVRQGAMREARENRFVPFRTLQ